MLDTLDYMTQINNHIPWNLGKKLRTERVCQGCGKKEMVYSSRAVRKYCSKECALKYKKTWNKGLIGFQSGENSPLWKGGIPNCKSCGKKLSIRHTKYNLCQKCIGKSKEHLQILSINHLNINTGNENANWKGDDVSYRNLHRWVERYLGKAEKCNECGKDSGRIHWSNKDHKYKRNLNDWTSLCPSCHKYYDLELRRNYASSG